MEYKKCWLVLLYFFVVFTLLAQNEKKLSNYKDFIKEHLVMGEKITNKNENYYLLLNVLAQSSNNNQLQPLGANEQLLVNKGNFQFYQTSKNNVQSKMLAQNKLKTQGANQPRTPNYSVSKTKEFFVAWNERTNKLAIVTGSLLIKMKNFSQSDELVQDYNLLKTHKFGGLNKLVIVKVDVMAINSTIAIIKKDHRVESVQAEILENFDYPQ